MMKNDESKSTASGDQSMLEKVSDKLPELSGKQKVVAGVGLAAAVAAGLAAIRKARSRLAAGEVSIYRLEPEGEGWKLTLGEDVDAQAHFESKEEGLAAARELANEQAPSELVVCRTDGSEQTRHRYDD